MSGVHLSPHGTAIHMLKGEGASSIPNANMITHPCFKCSKSHKAYMCTEDKSDNEEKQFPNSS